MKKSIFFLLISIMVNGVFAQEEPRDPGSNSAERIQKKVERLNAELQLTEQQNQQIKTILENHDKNTAAERASLRAKHEKTEQEISGILNDQQRQKFNTMKQNRQNRLEKMHGQGGARGSGRPCK